MILEFLSYRDGEFTFLEQYDEGLCEHIMHVNNVINCMDKQIHIFDEASVEIIKEILEELDS